jgi:hypothetical protein
MMGGQQQQHLSGGIQNLLQSQVPIPPGQLGGSQVSPMQQQLQHHQHLQQQQQQQALYQMQQQRIQDQQQMMRIRMQHHQEQQQQQQVARMVGNSNFEPPQQMVAGVGGPSMVQQQRMIGPNHPGTGFPMGQPGMSGLPRQINPMQQMINQVSNASIRHQQHHPMAGMGGPASGPMMPGVGGIGRMQPGGPGISPTGGLRLNIPPQLHSGGGGPMSGGGPITPVGCTPGGGSSALPSPSLTPRSATSERGEDDLDTGSSRGPTPGSDRMDGGSVTPDLADKSGGASAAGHHKKQRRPSVQQQKRRISVQDNSPGKNKRPRKGSQLQDGGGASGSASSGPTNGGGEYDNYIDSVVHQLKSLPPLPTVEPRLSHCFNACSVYGTGDIAKVLSKENEMQRCVLEGRFGAAGLPAEGDYYASMPFGPEPPVPYVPPLSVNQRGFYSQEFGTSRAGTSPATTPRLDGHGSPDLFYSSSPEPDLVPKKRARPSKPVQPPAATGKAEPQQPSQKTDVAVTTTAEATVIKKEIGEETSSTDPSATSTVHIKKEVTELQPVVSTIVVNESLSWYDLEPEDTDDELETGGCGFFGPPNIMSRPSSPGVDIVQPIPVRPRPGQSITLSDLGGLCVVAEGNKENKEKEGKGSGGTKKKQEQKGLLTLSGSLGVTPSPLKEKNNNGLTQVGLFT